MARDIWVLCGQSNSSGASGFAAMTNPVFNSPVFNPIMSAPYPNVLLSDKISSAPNDPIVWDVEDRSAVALQGYSGGTMGTALQLGRRLDQLNAPLGKTVGIAQVSITSSFLGGPASHWLPSGTYPASTQPPNLFNMMINQALAAQTAMSGTVVGAVWVQGEADAGNGAAAAGYLVNFRAWITAFRASFPGALVVFPRVNCRNYPSLILTPTVRAAQETVACDPGCRMINVDDLPLPNGPHYDAQGYYEMGNRLAEACFALQNGTTTSGAGTSWRPVNNVQNGPKMGESIT